MSFDAPKKGMGSGGKVLIILGIIAGIALLACCGGVGLFVYKAQPTETKVPEEVAAKSSSIIPMDIDREKWEPVQAVEIELPLIMELDICVWKFKPGEGGMLLTRVQLKFGSGDASQEDIDRQIEQSFSQGGNQNQEGQMPVLNVDKSGDQDVTVLGQACKFRWIHGKRSGSDVEWREIRGHVRRGEDIIVVRLQVEAEHYDEDEIVSMLESAK